MSKPTEILLQCAEPRLARRCVQALGGPGLRVWTAAGDVPPDSLLQILITDGPPADQELPQPDLAQRLVAGELGLIRLAGETGADICLPADFTARELELACRLLGQVVRLRQERTAVRQELQTLRRLAFTDPLTSLPNRRAWDAELAARWSIASPEPITECLALLDLDHFKAINDRWGHAVGDEVLRDVGRRLAAAIFPPDFVARLGGDEFGLLLSGPATDLTARVEAVRLVACTQCEPMAVTASVGCAAINDKSPAAWDQLWHTASEALREAKAAGRQRTCLRPSSG